MFKMSAKVGKSFSGGQVQGRRPGVLGRDHSVGQDSKEGQEQLGGSVSRTGGRSVQSRGSNVHCNPLESWLKQRSLGPTPEILTQTWEVGSENLHSHKSQVMLILLVQRDHTLRSNGVKSAKEASMWRRRGR